MPCHCCELVRYEKPGRNIHFPWFLWPQKWSWPTSLDGAVGGLTLHPLSRQGWCWIRRLSVRSCWFTQFTGSWVVSLEHVPATFQKNPPTQMIMSSRHTKTYDIERISSILVKSSFFKYYKSARSRVIDFFRLKLTRLLHVLFTPNPIRFKARF